MKIHANFEGFVDENAEDLDGCGLAGVQELNELEGAAAEDFVP